MEWLKKYDNYYFVLGRTLLGLYFIVPGMTKVAGYQGYLDLMASKSVPLVEVLLPLTILVQVGAGLFLIAGKNLRVSALLLFGLTILINLFIHNFWALAGDPGQAHETQNFVKNLAIAAGLLVLATKDKS
ncbi:DoxX family protein [Porticoccaceae bacterium]|jgi:putative oxidoreductase|nr:DoxX family protein [Porticoccaceae bacterium]MBT6780608.1 DoxX family protein [Porticoccaceae bacterium]MDA7589009.1 DoxX family protein [Porticoccaceae bacterium]MDA9592760.1 DoxX family protein [Porticoccaceae bacterium]MDB2670029.1 DoxX family protein [Porticoccaceae bacterium]